MKHTRSFFSFLLLLLWGLMLAPHAAFAGASEVQKDAEIEARLISQTKGTGAEKTLLIGLEVRLAPDWHTYWRTPGDAGLPPVVDFHANQNDADNLDHANMRFPTPRRYTAYGMETIGYRDHVIFPIDVTLREVGKPLNVTPHVELLICKDICIPKSFDFKLSLPAKDATKAPEAKLLQEALDSLPGSPESAGLAIRQVERYPDKIVMTVKATPGFTEPDLFVENDAGVTFDRPKIELTKDARFGVFTLTPSDGLPKDVSLMNLPFSVTLLNGPKALEASVGEIFEPQKLVSRYAPLLQLVGFALLAVLGGFILNLTPCVLPVLSLKVMSVLKAGGKAEPEIRRSFFMTALGILTSFAVLGLGMVALKTTGKVVGWGVQFQEPGFLIFLILVLTFFAANLWDMFEIALPRAVADKIDPYAHPKLAGDFATGAFATLLATPCSAPFLGTAVAFALASGSKKILVIFLALGFGMALPYLAVAAFPHIAARLPKPGAWMNIVRRVLGLCLLASALWLLHVLSGEITQEGATTAGAAIAMILGSLALHKISPSPRFAMGISVLAVVLAISATFATVPPPVKIDPAWERFDEAAIQRHVAEGKIVFVDVTADWCLTCKANKRLVLSRPEVARHLFSDPTVIPMEADWTNPDPKITSFLQRHGRYGVPFNMVFGPKAPQGIALPEILTPRAVNKAIDEAAHGKCDEKDSLAC